MREIFLKHGERVIIQMEEENKTTYSKKEVCEKLGISRTTLYNLGKRNLINFVIIGKHQEVTHEELTRLLNQKNGKK